MRRLAPLLITALVTLFLAEGQRAFFASLFALGHEALLPALRPGLALLALMPLLALLAPLLPLPRWLDRDGALAVSAAAVGLFRVPMTHPALVTRLVGGALVLACAGVFLTWAVGYLERRAVVGGVVLGLVADQILRLAGDSYDLSLQPRWLPVQAILSLALLALIVWGGTRASPAVGDEGLERRAGGLRLRGALAFGALLFLDLHILGLPPVIAHWTGTAYPIAAGLVGVAGSVGLAATLLLERPVRGRLLALGLVVLVSAGALVGYWLDGLLPATAMAAGHLAVLLLVSRTLDPASGRRGGVMATAGLAVFTVATGLYALTFYPSMAPLLDGAVSWILGATGVLLAGCFILLPRPGELERPPFPIGAALVAGGAAAITLWLAAPGQPEAVEAPGPGEAPPAALRVMSWNLHYGFDRAWRFEPRAMARTIARVSPHVAALEAVAVGSPTAYGVDLPLWIGRRAGLRHEFSATVNGLLGDAYLMSAAAKVEALPLPAGGGEPAQMLRLVVPVDDTSISIHALHLGGDPVDRASQLRRALADVRSGAAVLLGALNGDPSSDLVERLRAAGFHDALDGQGTAGVRIDAIWIRGLRASEARVLRETPSAHRAVAATLHNLPPRIRSTDADDLQEP